MQDKHLHFVYHGVLCFVSYVLFYTAPGKVLFLDCKVLGQDEIEISWGWPLVSMEAVPSDSGITGVVDKSVTHVIIQYKEGEQLKRITAEKSPCIIKG